MPTTVDADRQRRRDLMNLPENSDYPCRKCPNGKSFDKAGDCNIICQAYRLWVDKRFENARIVVYGDKEVRYV